MSSIFFRSQFNSNYSNFIITFYHFIIVTSDGELRAPGIHVTQHEDQERAVWEMAHRTIGIEPEPEFIPSSLLTHP